MPYFQQSSDCTEKVGISPLMKCISAIHPLTYRTVPDTLDEYMQLDEKTSCDSLQAFCKGFMDYMVSSFAKAYL